MGLYTVFLSVLDVRRNQKELFKAEYESGPKLKLDESSGFSPRKLI